MKAVYPGANTPGLDSKARQLEVNNIGKTQRQSMPAFIYVHDQAAQDPNLRLACQQAQA